MIRIIFKVLFYIPSLIVYPVRVIGKSNLPKKGRVILTPNHQTNNDAVIIFFKFNKKFHYMAKKPLFKYKISNWFLRKMGAYPVHTSSSDLSAVKKTLTLLKNDEQLCIFPEGARLKTSQSNKLKNGVAMFALKTKTPIVPAHFVKKTNAFRLNTLLVGKPFNLSEMDDFKDKKIDKELLSKASEVISNHIHKLKTDYYNKKNNK